MLKYVLKNPFTYTENDDDSSRKSYPADVKSVGFRSQINLFCMFSYIEEL